MAFLERRGCRFRVIFRFQGRRYTHTLNTDNESVAYGLTGGIEKTLMLLDQKVLMVSLVERIRAAKTLKEGGVKLEEIAAALDIGEKQLGRDLKIANAPWMLTHLDMEAIGHTAAADLVEAAAAVDRVGDVQEHIAEWVAARRKVVGESKKLKALLTKALSDHWIALLKNKQPLDDNVAQTASFQATIDADANSVTVEGTLHLMNQPLDELKLAKAKLVAAQRVVDKYLEARSAIEGSQGPQDVAREEAKHLGLLINPLGLPSDASSEAPATETKDETRSEAKDGQ